jgi:type VI secretion system protein ImpC
VASPGALLNLSAKENVVMPKPYSLDRASVNLTASQEEPTGRPRPETPLRIALLGDFSGRGGGEAPATPGLAGRSPTRVDRDNLDQVVAQFGVVLRLNLVDSGAAPTTIRFDRMADFHPDRLFQRLPVFQALRELHADLHNPSTFAAAAARMRGWASATPAPPPEPAAPPPEPPRAEPGNLLDRILAATQEAPRQAERLPGGEEWHSFLQKIVGPQLLPRTDDAKQAELIAAVDEAVGEQMRALLHHPDFQAVEASWRAVEFLVRRLETGPHLQIHLLDVTKAELAADLGSSADLRATGTYRTLVEQAEAATGGVSWALLAGLQAFDHSSGDVELLGRIAGVAQRAGAPFLAEAGSRLLGCTSLAQTPHPSDWRPAEQEAERAWEALRRRPEACYLGLVLPRLLLRLPYGKDSSPTEQLAFEEMPEGSAHGDYLWGNPVVACVYLLAEAFRHGGADPRPGQEIGDLPAHVYREAGESRIKPCAEVVLGERAMEAILGKGLMPLLSLRDRDTVRLPRFQSLAVPAAPPVRALE